MFQFTTTNVINSDKDFTTGKALWVTKDASGSTPASLNIKRVNNFVATNVIAIYKAVATDAENAKATLDFSQVSGTAGDVFRLHIYVGLSQASQNSLYANDLQWKGKPFSVDFVWGTDATDTVKKLIKTINKYSAMVYNKKLLNVTSSGTYITIEAVDEYQRFKFINIEKFDADAYHGMGEYNVVRSLDNLTKKNSNAEVIATAEGYFVGKEGFGTYPFLLHNLRLPTYARNRWLALNQDETPIVGAKYNQYTIYYCVNRGILGDNAVGDLVKSRTTHVFYVKQDLATSFEAALAKVGTVITVNGKGTPDPGTVTGDIDTLQQDVTQLKTQIANKADKSELANKADTSALAGKQDTLSAGNGIDITGNSVSVKLNGDTLTADASGLKVTDGKFTEV